MKVSGCHALFAHTLFGEKSCAGVVLNLFLLSSTHGLKERVLEQADLFLNHFFDRSSESFFESFDFLRQRFFELLRTQISDNELVHGALKGFIKVLCEYAGEEIHGL